MKNPCAINPALFDSLDYRDHLRARAVCATCPNVRACLLLAVDIANEHGTSSLHRGPDGTWGGLLWESGSIHQFATVGESVAA